MDRMLKPTDLRVVDCVVRISEHTCALFDIEDSLVRAPRFEPGSSAWQADVLDQTRLRPLGKSVNPVPNKNLTTQTEAKIANTLIQLKADGRTADTRALYITEKEGKKLFRKHNSLLLFLRPI